MSENFELRLKPSFTLDKKNALQILVTPMWYLGKEKELYKIRDWRFSAGPRRTLGTLFIHSWSEITERWADTCWSPLLLNSLGSSMPYLLLLVELCKSFRQFCLLKQWPLQEELKSSSSAGGSSPSTSIRYLQTRYPIWVTPEVQWT